MSYGAGGVGLNLQFGSYVFLFDRWWNPAVEDQAINRAHRIGVAGPVTVTRFLTLDTIEERIDQVLRKSASCSTRSSPTREAAETWGSRSRKFSACSNFARRKGSWRWRCRSSRRRSAGGAAGLGLNGVAAHCPRVFNGG